MLVLVLVGFVTFLIGFKLYQKFTCRMCTCEYEMVNKVVIITGANTGIGYETAKDLARRKAKVIIACRDPSKGTKARDCIIESTSNGNVHYKQLDLSSFESVRAFAADIINNESKVDVLINNAGTGKLDNHMTEDNLPVEAQVNHYGPFLLTMLLLPKLKASAPSRIINVSSVMQFFGKVDPDIFHKQAKNFFMHAFTYSNTKLANVLFTKKLSKELEGSGVTVNCLHPGAVNTDIFKMNSSIVRFLIRLVFRTSVEGAQTSIYLAVSPDVANVSGRYFVDCAEAAMCKSANDVELADRFWESSKRVVGI